MTRWSSSRASPRGPGARGRWPARRAPRNAAIRRPASRRGSSSSPPRPGQGASAPPRVAALMGTNYASATIAADRGQRSFRLSLDQFLAKRGGSAIVSRGRALKQSQAALFASIEQRYGVPPGPLLAIWGMETAFGGQRGNQNIAIGRRDARL